MLGEQLLDLIAELIQVALEHTKLAGQSNGEHALDGWLKRARRSRLAPIKKVARSIRAHQDLILNWFAAKKEFSSGIVEGLNYRVKLTIRKAYGVRMLEAAPVLRLLS